MKFVFSLLCYLGCSLGIMAQQQRFVYIQTENNQTFYVQMDSAIFSSAASGYLLISDLPDSNYKLIIGFPKNEWPSQQYTIPVKGSDEGRLLKYASNKWTMTDILSGAVINPIAAEDDTDNIVDERTDPFATMLSSAVGDPTLKQWRIRHKLSHDDSIREAEEAKLPLRTTITKLSTKKIPTGTELIYTDMSADYCEDTIRIILPSLKKGAAKQAAVSAPAPAEESTDIASQEVAAKPAKSVKKKSEHFLNMSVTPEKTTDSTAINKPVVAVQPKPVDTTTATTIVSVAQAVKKDTVASAPHIIVNSECKNLATQEDFIKLRRKMADQKDDNSMLNVAKKVFRTRCFSTDQIKNLGALFFSEQGRYSFFETAYEIVSDSQNYGDLRGQLSDPYYIGRFDAMMHH